MKVARISIFLLAVSCVAVAQGADQLQKEMEVLAHSAEQACQGKNKVSPCVFRSPRGERIIGTCEEVGKTQVCRPFDFGGAVLSPKDSK